MNDLLISLCIGLVAALIDIVPMIIEKLDQKFIFSAFFMWIIVGFLSYKLELMENSTINGLLTAILLFIPLSFLIYKMDKKAILQVSITTVILGCLIGFFTGLFI